MDTTPQALTQLIGEFPGQAALARPNVALHHDQLRVLMEARLRLVVLHVQHGETLTLQRTRLD